jgi:hypothetical protein
VLLSLSFAGNPIAAAQDYRLEPLIAIRTLNRLDKNVYEDDEKSEAKEVWSRCIAMLFVTRPHQIFERREAQRRQDEQSTRQNHVCLRSVTRRTHSLAFAGRRGD